MSFKATAWDGEPISKPGMYSGIDADIYHAAKICDGHSISSSGLRTIFNESPAHFFCHWRGNPKAVEQKESRALIVGRAAHHLLLGQAKFAGLFAIQPTEYEDEKTGEVKPWNNNANACKRWHVSQRKAGLTVLTANEGAQITGMATALADHPIVKAGALNGAVERSLFWKDKVTGIWLKSRPDAIPGDGADFVDLKTTESVQWPDLVRTIGEYGYFQQGALIRRAAREVLKIDRPTFSLVFVEKSPPHCVRVVTLKDNDLDRGDKANAAALAIFARCIKSGHWPGPGGDHSDAEPIELSTRQQELIDERLDDQQEAA